MGQKPEPNERAAAIGARVERSLRELVMPFERDSRCGAHGPPDDLVQELRGLARAAGVLTPHLTQRETARALIRSGLLPLGPVALSGKRRPTWTGR